MTEQKGQKPNSDTLIRVANERHQHHRIRLGLLVPVMCRSKRNKALSDDVVIRTGAPPSGDVVMRKIRASPRHRRHQGRLV